MHDTDNQSKVYLPTDLHDCLTLYNKMSNALIFAGGSYLKISGTFPAAKGRPVISLQGIQELQRVVHTNRYIEIGAALPIQQLLQVGKNILPESLIACLRQVSPPSIRNLATLGGNICVNERVMTGLPYLVILDSFAEVRRHNNSRWIPVSKLRNENGFIDLGRGEIVTRIRLPIERWTHQTYQSISPAYITGDSVFSFYGLAKSARDVLTDLRFAFRTNSTGIIRFKEIETDIIGRKLPMTLKEVSMVSSKIKNLLEEENHNTAPHHPAAAKHLLDWFLRTIPAVP